MSEQQQHQETHLLQSLMYALGVGIPVGLLFTLLANGGWVGFFGVGLMVAVIGWRHGYQVAQGVQKHIVVPIQLEKRKLEQRKGARLSSPPPTKTHVLAPPAVDDPLPIDNDETKVVDEEDMIITDEEEDFAGVERMNFGETLRPEANKIFSGRKVLFGVSDAGKSNAVATIVEEIGGYYGAPLFLLDTEDEYRALSSPKYLAKPLWMERAKLPPERAFEFAQWAVAGLRQVIINLQSYEDHEAAWLMINLIKGVKAWEEAHEMRIPCEFILDEATVWLPQNASQSTLNRIMVDDPDGRQISSENEEEENDAKQVSLLSLLERAFFSVVVRRGRKRGMGFTLAAQRIAEINKSALSANWTFLMKQTQVADFRVYKQFGIEAKDAMEMHPGEAFVFAPGNPMERHRFRLRKSPHGAKSPGLEELRQYQRSGVLAPPMPDLAPKPVPTQAKQTALLDYEDIPRPVPTERSSDTIVNPVAVGHTSRSVLPPDLQMALNEYRPGMSHRDLARALGVSHPTAGKYLQRLKDMRMIDMNGQIVSGKR